MKLIKYLDFILGSFGAENFNASVPCCELANDKIILYCIP